MSLIPGGGFPTGNKSVISTAAPTSQSTTSFFGSTSGSSVATLQPATSKVGSTSTANSTASIFGSTGTPKPAAFSFGNVATSASSTTQPTTSFFGSTPAPAKSTTKPFTVFFGGADPPPPVVPSFFGNAGTSKPLFSPVPKGSIPLAGSLSVSAKAPAAAQTKTSTLIVSNPVTTVTATTKRQCVPAIPVGGNTKVSAALYASPDEELSDDYVEEMPSLDEQMCLLSMDTLEGEEPELANTDVKNAVMFTADVLKKTKHRKLLPQYSLLGEVISTKPSTDSRLFLNTNHPWSIFICGLQGSGKSHSLSCLLESCLLPTRTLGVLNRPLSAMVFHFSAYTSEHAFRPCEAAFLAVPNPSFNIKPVPVTILVPPSNYLVLKAAYGQIPNVKVYPLRLRPKDLNINAMLTLMSVNANNSNPPLYMSTVTKILRDMAAKSTVFDFKQFRRELVLAKFDERQMKPLEQRLEVLESFLAPDGRNGGFEFKEGSITIVDLSCPFVDENTACVLFNICLGVYLQDNSSVAGKVVAVDEAHKYITKSPASKILTESLLALIRQQRHYGARIIISTQEPTVDPRLMDLCSATLVHRFTSPVWFSVLKKHISVIEDETKDAELFRKMVDLRVGQGLLFASSAVINGETAVDLSVEIEKKKNAIEKKKIEIEQKKTEDEKKTGDEKKTEDEKKNEDEKEKNETETEEKKNESGDKIEDTNDEVQVEDEGILEKLGSRFLKIKIRKRLTADGGKSLVSV